MIIGFPKEYDSEEQRVAISPSVISLYSDFGFKVLIESGAGRGSFFYDDQYIDSGAEIASNPDDIYKESDIIVSIDKINEDKIALIKQYALLVSLIDIADSENFIKKVIAGKVTGLSMSMIPRTTLAQKMDVLSSQSNIAGYRSVLIGSCHLKKYMPLLMTAAGTIKPARVLVLGAGVAGLSAVATAKRLGAQVKVFDVRPDVKEQVESLGAKFVDVNFDAGDISTDDGYAKETSKEYQEHQSNVIANHISNSDLVITTALIPGKPAPVLVSREMVDRMSPGSVIMDLAAINGGNCELTEKGKVIIIGDVVIDGTTDIPGLQSIDASELYSKNVSALLLHILEKGSLNILIDDEIASNSIYIYKGEPKIDMVKHLEGTK